LLTDLQVRKAKNRDRAYKIADSLGLYLFVTTTGAKSWRFKYRFGDRLGGKAGKIERKLVFGMYPEMTLEEAREARDSARRLLKQGIDPGVRKKQEAAAASSASANTFELIAREYHRQKSLALVPKYGKAILSRLETHVFRELGGVAITEITAPMVLKVIRAIEAKGSLNMAHRVRGHVSEVFVHGISTGRCANDPAAIIQRALVPIDTRLRPAIRKIEPLRAMLAHTETRPSYWATKLASRLLALTAARPGVVERAERSEFEDLDGKAPIWRIPALKMKLTRERKRDVSFEFVIPLSKQAVEVVKLAMQLSPSKTFLFPAWKDSHSPISNSTVSKFYRASGFTGIHVPHGWRSSFSTIMNEAAAARDRQGDRAVIDLMLAHMPDDVEAVYNRAAYMPRRRMIAQAWADLLMKDAEPADTLIANSRR
jgi:integrase